MSLAHQLPSVAPTSANPGRCSKCDRTKLTDGRPMRIHWSYLRSAWLCLWCHFEAPT